MTTEDKINILVVDDLPDKLLALVTVLETLGENVVTARSGREALRRLLERDYAVILLDVKMPDMDGFETASLIRGRRKTEHTPIIFVTALSDETHLNQGYSLGAVDYILSPVSPEVLRTKVGVFVDLFRMTEQVRRQAEERVSLAREQAARAAAEEAARRLRFLAEAGAVLGRSLDATAILRGLAKLAVPFLADFAAAVLVEPDGAWRTETTGASEDASLPTGVAERIRRTLTVGKTVPADGAPACLAVPLKTRGRTIGALALGGPGRRYAAEDVTLAEDLACRAAAALENARLYHDLEEQDRRKSEFLAMLAHELRNPLAPIRNAVQILRRAVTEEAGREWAQDVIDRQVGQMVRLVDDLLDVSRITRGKVKLKPEPIDVSRAAAVALETSRPLIDARRHELTVTLPPEPLWATADAARLAQVLANLLNNAAKYTEEGGRIGLTVAREGNEAVFRVRDTGVGIPADMLPRVFELFTQVDRSLDRSEGGLGIGLTLAHRLVEMHGGTVQAFSDGPGRGSEFVVRLAALPRAPAHENPQIEVLNGLKEVGGLRILVVDDNRDSANSLAMLLEDQGHTVRTAHDGEAALTAADAFGPDAVVLDIGLPRLDGYEVARRLRAARPDTGGAIPPLLLIALTGYGHEENRLQAKAAGFDHHFVKPVDLDVLQDLFAARVRERRANRPPSLLASPV